MFSRIWEEIQEVLDDRILDAQARFTRIHRFFHFWVMVWRSVERNRLFVRASGLAYMTLLALIPMLAVAVSVTSSFLKQEGEDRIDKLIVQFVSSVMPPDVQSTNPAAPMVLVESTNTLSSVTNDASALTPATVEHGTNQVVMPAFVHAKETVRARREIARNINIFIQNTRSGALGVTGSILLIFAAISMLSRVETTFNDIWGVQRGRSWYMRVVLYWGVITLTPLLLVVALGLATGPYTDAPKEFLSTMPIIGNLVFQFLPIVVLCLTFSLFYILMPNTKVDWRAALMGGLAGGVLFHLNNVVSVLYVSRVVSNSKIYGSLGLVPVFMMGLYFSWLILLLGAQVAYGYQNRASYLEERQVENVNQRGREFVALRLMTRICQHFLHGEHPPSAPELSQALAVPSRLIRQIMQTLCAARLVVETSGAEIGYSPARPLEQITCHDILTAMRASHGQELSTREEPARAEILGEFHRFQEAERQVAAGVTMLTLASRALPALEEGNADATPPSGQAA